MLEIKYNRLIFIFWFSIYFLPFPFYFNLIVHVKGAKSFKQNLEKSIYKYRKERRKKMEKTSEKKIFQTRKLCIEKSCKKKRFNQKFYFDYF